MRRLLTWADQRWCALWGHQFTYVFSKGHLGLRCGKCQWRTRGLVTGPSGRHVGTYR